jgi:L-lactate dehydrogenase complex protein LldE
MTVRLMLTCLCDAFYGEVGIATVRVLEHAGCTVEFPKEQTCCGQPPFNSGDWDTARAVAAHWKEVFRGGTSRPPGVSTAPESTVVTPSSSCAAMIREGFPLIFPPEDPAPAVYELGEFLVKVLKIEKWPLAFAPEPLSVKKIVYHRACHGRGLHLTDEQERLLRSIPGIALEPLDQAEQCCGFGGAFSVGHPSISAGIGMEKLKHVIDTGATILVSGDMGCLMHLRGLIEKNGLKIETRHFAEILADAIPAPVPV